MRVRSVQGQMDLVDDAALFAAAGSMKYGGTLQVGTAATTPANMPHGQMTVKFGGPVYTTRASQLPSLPNTVTPSWLSSRNAKKRDGR